MTEEAEKNREERKFCEAADVFKAVSFMARLCVAVLRTATAG
jgi:hypothetical protein